jgi:hypothetical protein
MCTRSRKERSLGIRIAKRLAKRVGMFNKAPGV